MQCPWCGAENRRTFVHCIACGRDIHRQPPAQSVVITDPDDGERPIGAYVLDGALVFEVREAASAPVAGLERVGASMPMAETGGGVVATVERHRHHLPDRWLDDRWVLYVTSELPTLDRRALVAAPVVCHRMLSLPPHRPP